MRSRRIRRRPMEHELPCKMIERTAEVVKRIAEQRRERAGRIRIPAIDADPCDASGRAFATGSELALDLDLKRWMRMRREERADLLRHGLRVHLGPMELRERAVEAAQPLTTSRS